MTLLLEVVEPIAWISDVRIVPHVSPTPPLWAHRQCIADCGMRPSYELGGATMTNVSE